GSVSQTVNRILTTTTLTSSANPSISGDPVTFTATVIAASGTATGNVSFKCGNTLLGTVALDPSGVATITVSSLPVGRDKIVASYLGDTVFAPSHAVLVQTVNATATVIALDAMVIEPKKKSIAIPLLPTGAVSPARSPVLNQEKTRVAVVPPATQG